MKNLSHICSHSSSSINITKLSDGSAFIQVFIANAIRYLSQKTDVWKCEEAVQRAHDEDNVSVDNGKRMRP